tara:strand:+ start:1442 stop:2086 length:645 start_codon:yes stop_codon:yes gene_type:complete
VTTLLGPNGAGKSTLAHTIMGSPNCTIEQGSIILDNEDITKMDASERARKGLFLSFQYPVEVPGVNLANFLRQAYIATKGKIGVFDFKKLLEEKMQLLGIDASFTERNLNEGFSGGEKKRAELLQLAILQPKLAILDETDSGLDMDGLDLSARGINTLKEQGMGVLVITHYDRMLDKIQPDAVHVLVKGKIVKTGDISVAKDVTRQGFSQLQEV